MTQPLPAAGRDGKQAALVQAMFDRVAPRYDLTNRVLSLGQDAHWRRVAARAAQPAGGRLLDVAAGPGELARELIRHGAAEVIALDLSLQMLRAGAQRADPGVHYVNGDALALPVADASVDAVTIAFGLRNLIDPQAGLREFARVARPGAVLVVLEFARPVREPLRSLYGSYLMRALPEVARLVSSSAPAYRYLAESIAAWPDRATIAAWIEAAGFRDVQVKDLTGGIVAVHRATRA